MIEHWRARESNRICQRANHFAVAICRVAYEISSNHLRIFEDLVDTVYRRGRHACRVERSETLGDTAVRERSRYDWREHRQVAKPVGIACEAAIGGDFRDIHRMAELFELLVVTDDQHHLAVFAAEVVARVNRSQPVSHRLWRFARRQKVHADIGQRRHLHVEECHIDMLSQARLVALAQCGKDADRRVQRGHLVGDGDTCLARAGAYVHMVSTSGLIGNLAQANYSAAKLGIAALSKSIAMDMEKFNVRSNCISPFAWSRMIGSIPTETAEQKARVERLKRMETAKISPLAVYLVSDAARHVSGQIFAVRANEIFLMSQIRPVRSMHTAEGWTPQTIAEHAMPAMRSSFYQLDRSQDVFDWDPV